MNVRWSLFPKSFPHLDPHELAGLVREVGLDTTNLVIREGYWVSPENLAADLPRFMRAMRAEGLDIRFATAGFTVGEIVRDDFPLALLADEGIAEFRMGYFSDDGKSDPREARDRARVSMDLLVTRCERRGIRAVYQVHHNTLIPGPSAAYALVQGLPSRYVGVELDAGNQSHEGFENWGVAAGLLREYLVALGVKDSCLVRDPARASEPGKGWRRSWCPLDEGVTNWHDVARAFDAVGFDGTFVFMPFYDADDPAAITPKLKREVAYLRRVVAEVVS